MIRRNRVLFVDSSAAVGGGELAMLNLLRQLDKETIETFVVLMEEGPLIQRLNGISEVYVQPLDKEIRQARRHDLKLRSSLSIAKVGTIVRYVRSLMRMIDELKIDIVHTNSLKAAVIGGVAGRLKGRPVVWHLRNRISDDYLPRNIVKVYRLLAKVIPTFIVSNSQATLDTLALRSTKNTAIVPSGAVNIQPEPPPIRAQTDALTVGLVGRICPWKGQHIFIEAAALLHPKFPKVRFLIVGAPLFREFDYEASLRELAKSRGLESVVEFTGHRDDVPQIMRDLDIVVHASTVGEPLGQVIIEGMAAGRPVVATRGGGTPEIVVEGVTGFLVPMGDAAAIAGAVERLARDPALRASMGANGHRRVVEHFTIEQTASKVQEVYRKLDKRRSPHSNLYVEHAPELDRPA